MKCTNGNLDGGISRFFNDDVKSQIIDDLKVRDDDIVFIIGHLRSYISYLDLNNNDLINQFKKEKFPQEVNRIEIEKPKFQYNFNKLEFSGPRSADGISNSF